jgi:hypothetical protein
MWLAQRQRKDAEGIYAAPGEAAARCNAGVPAAHPSLYISWIVCPDGQPGDEFRPWML